MVQLVIHWSIRLMVCYTCNESNVNKLFVNLVVLFVCLFVCIVGLLLYITELPSLTNLLYLFFFFNLNLFHSYHNLILVFSR